MPHSPFHEIDEELAEEERNLTVGEEFAPDEFAWADYVAGAIVRDIGNWGNINKVDSGQLEYWWGQLAPDLMSAIETNLFAGADSKRARQSKIYEAEIRAGADPFDFGVGAVGRDYYLRPGEGQEELLDWARNWMSAKSPMDITDLPRIGSGGGRGSGSRKPTAAEIRQQFDIEQLANSVNSMNRALVLQEHKDPTKLAREYVDAVVRTGGEQQIDFQTFVRSRIETTSRFKSIYANKPDSVSAEQYMAPYFQAALQMTRPEEADEVAIGGAQFGASAESFRQRLERTDAQTGSAPFITQLEGRLGALNQVLRG